MSLQELRLLIDFGFVVLIWVVQLVIYPSFNYYSTNNLFKWHRKYTTRVTFIIFPLMFSQLVVALIQSWQLQNWYTILSVIIILSLWIITFLVFVPLHQSIDKQKPVDFVCDKLVNKNIVRTILWTALFGISLFYYLSY